MDNRALEEQFNLLLRRDRLTMELPMLFKGEKNTRGYTLSPRGALQALKGLGVNIKWQWKAAIPQAEEKEGGEKFSKKYDYDALVVTDPHGLGVQCAQALRWDFINKRLAKVNTLVFVVPDDYRVYRHTGRDWMSSNPADIMVLRSMMWHELMEHAFVYLNLFHEDFKDNYGLTEKYKTDSINFNKNEIHWKVREKQIKYVNASAFYHWTIELPDQPDPPGCQGEREAWQHEGNARDAQDWAMSKERLDWHTAAEKWEEARKYWKLAADAWRFRVENQRMDAPGFVGGRFSCHPDPEGNAKECEENAETAKERRDAALQETQQGATKPAPSWNVAGSGGGKITIHYSDWPHGFRAKILDYKERKVTEVSGTPGSKEGKVEWGKDADPGTYYVEVNVSGERSEKVIITKKLEWSACVKFGTNGPYISITPKSGTKWPKGKGFGFSIHPYGASKIGYVNVSDSNQTVEVTWGRESNQRFGDWGKHTIWAYANDPGLQEMFKDKNFFPNWKTEVEIPVPSFKVNGAKASVAVAAKGPLIAPDTEQSLSIEYDNWPGKFKGIRQVSIALFRIWSSIRRMKMVRLSFSLLAVGVILISSLGCEEKPHWLRIYCEGEFKDSINVRGWRKNEDVVKIDEYYYPWQGEDSINYSFHVPSYDTTLLRPYSYLNVNGRLVGVDPFGVRIENIPYKEEVLTLMRYDTNYKLLPNLVMLPRGICSVDDIDRLDSMPRNLRLYVYIYSSSAYGDVDIIPEVLPRLVRFRNIRVLEMKLIWKNFEDDLPWTRWLCRMRGVRRVIFRIPDGTSEGEEARLKSHLRCLPRLRAVELQGYFILTTG